MTDLVRLRVGITWDSGSPGVCTYYFSPGSTSSAALQAESAANDIAEAWGIYSDALITGLEWTVEQEVDLIDVDSGNIVDQFDHGVSGLTGSGGNASKTMSRAQQIYVRFRTSDYFEGKRLAGGSFIGPVGGSVVDPDGQVGSAAKTVYEEAWDAAISGLGARLAVYSPPRPARAGRYGDVTSIRCANVLGSLRSRRD